VPVDAELDVVDVELVVELAVDVGLVVVLAVEVGLVVDVGDDVTLVVDEGLVVETVGLVVEDVGLGHVAWYVPSFTDWFPAGSLTTTWKAPAGVPDGTGTLHVPVVTTGVVEDPGQTMDTVVPASTGEPTEPLIWFPQETSMVAWAGTSASRVKVTGVDCLPSDSTVNRLTFPLTGLNEVKDHAPSSSTGMVTVMGSDAVG